VYTNSVSPVGELLLGAEVELLTKVIDGNGSLFREVSKYKVPNLVVVVDGAPEKVGTLSSSKVVVFEGEVRDNAKKSIDG
jgi:hypothetical protein